MTGIDTAALRAAAEDAEQAAYAVSVSLHPATVRALCDGYDEAARLRGEVALASGALRPLADNNDAYTEAELADVVHIVRVRVEGHDELLRQREQANRNTAAARQALADLVADLRALCDEAERGYFLPAVRVAHIRAVIDRHAPATPTTEEDR